MALTEQTIKALKAEGFLHNRGTENFSARIITGNGTLQAEMLTQLSHLSKTYGDGMVSLTGRLTVEIPGIPYSRIPSFREEIASLSLTTGGTGAKVRPVVACKGSTCIYGLADTQSLAQRIHTAFYEGWHEVIFPHKFKIAVGGCPNSCVKPELNDLGIVGQKMMHLSPECKACGRCISEKRCPMGAIKQREDGKRYIDRSLCNNCSRCLDTCPFGKINADEPRYKLYLGGRWGKQKRYGTPLPLLYSEEQLFPLITRILNLYKEEGRPGERFASVVERLGMDHIARVLHETV